ncbi:beta-galactosidase [Ruminococcus sp. YE71]|uniref:glycoside hydrolase family 2 TIM barrel-domain containing protein n=1 Tax=unclassified Ruminococcus TaxID=2608920 RepID=UPI0008883B71|nr:MULTISPECIES: glycoside hydrolase family 2 TIM barrel-domain containing protein [unclassified Ruminococcus]SDA24207.1 beta-galactosidase [Ruminococcus sp. YE78]SFW41586.1 beta-galactosidase [Ruminococcus sp. YE71]
MNDIILSCGWSFCKLPFGSECPQPDSFAPVELPHDWLIYDTKNLYETSTGWYRKTITVPDDGKRTSIRFEGVYMDSKVYVNGVLAGEWKYGYTTFEFDITDLVKPGENVITVRVDYIEPNSRWYSGAGIFRKVLLRRYAQTHILPDGVYISARNDGSVTVMTEAARPADESVEGYRVRTKLYKKTDGEPQLLTLCDSNMCAADRSVLPDYLTADGFRYSVNEQRLNVDEPQLWDITDPQLYLCEVYILKNGEVIDSVSSDFGFRSAEFTADKGFFLNGRHVKLHGACQHHDLGALGAAVNKAALRRQFVKLREMGINAIRTSHNPPSVEFMELADEMGFLILSECFDMWELKKTDYDYARFFPEWHRRDVASWVRRDRNHPSVFAWSIGNEIYDTHASDRGQEVTSMLMHEVRRHDPFGNGYVTIGSNYMGSEPARRCADILKTAGYNYAERLYDEHHAEHPDWFIYGSETSSVVQSRGIYHFPKEQAILCDDDEQCSALGNSSPGWAARSTESCIIPDRDAEFCAGQFIWTGFDYIGEPTPYSTKNSYFGQIDTAGFFKDSAYIFRAAWTDCKTAPFVHLYPYWDWNEGEIIDVRAATNAPLVRLFLNGEQIAEQTIDVLHGDTYTLDAKVAFVRGELTAVAYDEEGREVARDTRRSFGDTASVRLTPDKTELTADGKDLVFIEIDALDRDGNTVDNANDRVTVSVSGAGRLVGLDNGDSTDYDRYKGTSRRLFSGKLLAIVAATTEAGEITVTVKPNGLPESTLNLTSSAHETVTETDCIDECRPCDADCVNAEDDIPVRRIGLIPECREFSPSRREIRVRTVVYPENATYSKDIDYRLTTVSGIDVNNAVIRERSAEGVTIEAMGDGVIYLKALCKNGTDKYHVLSTVKLTADGLGCACIDPYSMVYGGLYSLSDGNVCDGLDHGATIGGEGGWFGFTNVDFGAVGSDTVTVPIFANTLTPVRIRFYDGSPAAGGELIGDFEYGLTPIWLTYQPMTYKLSKVLTGVHTICIGSDERYDVQGFVFERRAKETSELAAVNCENIYGDKFTIGTDAVTGIGNNVMLSFGEFDFAEAVDTIVICGRSQLPVNSIHIIFFDENGAEIRRELCEFEQADDYTCREFAIGAVRGKVKVQLCFLPGSDFDLKSIKFR